MDLKPHPGRETVTWMDTSKLSPEALEKEKKLFDDKAFVRKATPPKELLTKKTKPARFSSEDEQYVIEERKAHKSGLTANRANDAVHPAQPQGEQMSRKATSNVVNLDQKTKKSSAKPSLNLNPKTPLQSGLSQEIAEARADSHKPLVGQGTSDVQVAGLDDSGAGQSAKKGHGQRDVAKSESVPMDIPNFMGAERGDSTVGEALPDDIKFGEFTALNTDRNLFYSFYSRMEEVIRPRWVGYARAAVYQYESGARHLTGRENWTTKVEILLDKDGNYIRAIIHGSSGSPTFDAAPVDAFRAARQFPHPPPEMVKDDGMVHIYYGFTVSFAPNGMGGE